MPPKSVRRHDCAQLLSACAQVLWTARVAILARRSPTLPACHEAHLPAQEAQARPHPRVPRAHEHARRPHRAQAPPRQGPQAAHRLTAADACPRAAGHGAGACRAAPSSSASIARAGRIGNRYLVLYAFPRGDAATLDADDGPRLGVSRVAQGRRRGRAQQVKRLLREAFATRGRAPARQTTTSSSSRAPTCASWPSARASTGVRGALAELVSAAAVAA